MSSASTTRFNTTSHGTGDVQINNVDGDLHIHNVYQMTPDQEHRVYEWLGAPDSSGNFHAAREKHHGNTGSWFLGGEEYVKWKETPDSTLWVYGTPGCGKTIICSTVIEKIRAEWAAESSFSSAYFFFDNRNAQTDLSLHDKFIRSIIKQLSHQSASFPAPLVDLYGGGQQQPSIQSLQLILEKIIDGFERTFIIIDAVDECTDREKTLAWIEQLTQRKKGNLQVLFSSRPEQDIIEKLRCMAYIARVTLNSKLADKDIETYIDVMLSKMLRWDAQTIARVKDALITDSDGMFRWVAFQISELFKCRTRRAVDDQLRDLPKDLEGMYERALLNSPYHQDLQRSLMWLAFSSYPLQPEELADVVTVDLSSNGLPLYDPDLRYFGTADMLITCSGFVTETYGLTNDNPSKPIRVIKLAHMSVKDYLVSDRIKAGAASYFSINAMLSHSLIAKTCLAYVFYLRSFSSFMDSVLESFPLAIYAARYWINHMRLGGGEDQHLSQMMDNIFSLDDGALVTWVRLDDTDDSSMSSQMERRSADIASPLYYACINGLTSVAQDLLVCGADVNERGGYYGNALQAASERGRDIIVRLLLEKGADVNERGGYYGSALHAASDQGHEAIVRLLLAKGGNVNEQGGNALQVASERGHEAIIQLLLEKGADVSVQGDHYGNALQAASYGGHDPIVRLFLEKGADVNTQGGHYGHALQAASHRGHEAIVRLFLENGADVNAQGGYYGNALQAASQEGHDAIIRLFLEKGADVNAQGGHYGHALQAASSKCHEAIIRLLLAKGANVNSQGGHHGNALQAASDRGHEAIVRLFLEKGADVNALGGHYGNALQAASCHGHEAIVRLLLAKGANINAQGGVFGSALRAARLHEPGVVKILLEYEEEQAKKHMHGEENEEQDGAVDVTEIEGDGSSGSSGSEDEWASAQEDVEDM